MPSERKFKGVNFVSRLSRYRAVIYANNKQIHIGYFTGSVAAAKAYDKAAIAPADQCLLSTFHLKNERSLPTAS